MSAVIEVPAVAASAKPGFTVKQACRLRELRLEAAKLKKAIEALEEQGELALDANRGEPICFGIIGIRFAFTERRCPRWKELWIGDHSEEEGDEVIALTEPSISRRIETF